MRKNIWTNIKKKKHQDQYEEDQYKEEKYVDQYDKETISGPI